MAGHSIQLNEEQKDNKILVQKRDGDLVPFNVAKIKKAIEWACEGLKVNPLELESRISLNVKNNMSTVQIQESLISIALSLTNIEKFENLDWRFVASRLLLLNLYKESKRTRGHDYFGYGSYYIFIKKAVDNGIYDKQILQEYSEEEIREFEKERNPSYDYDYDYAGMNLLKTRYLMKLEGNTFELPQDMYLTIALLLAIPEKKENRLNVAKQIYHATASKKLSLATPIVLNLRRVNGNLASCFITSMDDDLENIYYTLDQLAQISKNAGGVGVNISRVRSQGAYIKHHKGASGGVLPWIKLINDTAIAVDQLGSRSGAITVALDVWHRDIEGFLDMQTENGDQRRKSFDIFPQVVVTDLFMKRVENDELWTLVDPHEIRKKYKIELAELYGEGFEKTYSQIEKDENLEFKKIVPAKDLFKEFLKVVVETGMPYVFFKDTVNNANPNKNSGMIGNANLCVESYSNFKPTKLGKKILSKDLKSINQEIDCGEVHTCNLISLNLAKFDDDKTISDMTKLAVRILDNTIDVSIAPLNEAQKHNLTYRIIGIGSMGLADYLAKRGISYDKSSEEVSELFEKIAYYGINASSDLANERGTYLNYNGSDWEKGIFFGKTIEELNPKRPQKWKELSQKIKKQGMRNGGLFAIAPNTSTSLLCGVTASVLPVYKKFFVDKASNGAVPVAAPFLSQETFWKYKENQNLDQKKIIEIISNIQKWTDQGISMELVLNFNNGISAKNIYELYLEAWKKKCKTVYYVRSVTKNANEGCMSCAN